jgi:hypothetical protein
LVGELIECRDDSSVATPVQAARIMIYKALAQLQIFVEAAQPHISADLSDPPKLPEAFGTPSDIQTALLGAGKVVEAMELPVQPSLLMDAANVCNDAMTLVEDVDETVATDVMGTYLGILQVAHTFVDKAPIKIDDIVGTDPAAPEQ